MITRIFRVLIKPLFKKEFEEKFQELSVSIAKNSQGLLSIRIGKSLKNSDEYIMISKWKNKTALEQLEGEIEEHTLISEELKPFLLECNVEHYETTDLYDPFFMYDTLLLRRSDFRVSLKYYVTTLLNKPVLYVHRSSTFFRNFLAVLLGLIGGFLVMMLMGYFTKQIFTPTDEPNPLIFIIGFLSFFIGMFVIIFFASATRYIRFYYDDTKANLLFEISQDKKFTIMYRNNTYFLKDHKKQVLAIFQKIYSIRKKRWNCYDPNGTLLCSVRGKEKTYSNEFIFVQEDTNNLLGELNLGVFYPFEIEFYYLDLSKDISKEINRRIAIALAVLIDMEEHH